VKKARELYERALAINQSEDKRAAAADNLNNLGTLSLYAGDADAAIGYYGRALEIDRDLEIPEAIALDLFNIASAHYAKGDYPAAIDYFGRSLAIFDFTSNHRRVAETLYRIGLASEKAGDTSRARESYNSAHDVARAAGMQELAEKARSKLDELAPAAGSSTSE
jgi:tetratricopeptide (TPR) repeat protein